MCENLWGAPTCSAHPFFYSESFPDLRVWSHRESLFRGHLENMKARTVRVTRSSFSGVMWVTTSTTHGTQHTSGVRDRGWWAGCHCTGLASSPKVGFGKLYFCLISENIFLKTVFIKAYLVVLRFSKENCFCVSIKENCGNIPGVRSGPETFRSQKQRTFNPDQAD